MVIIDSSLGNVGSLRLERLWYRPDAREFGHHNPTVSEFALPLGSIAVVPEAVVYWDNPRPPRSLRVNNMKRFRYMLSLRAHPFSIENAPDEAEVIKVISCAGLPDMRDNLPAPAEKIASAILRFLEDKHAPNSRQANTFGMQFRYMPPVGIDDLRVLRTRIEEHLI